MAIIFISPLSALLSTFYFFHLLATINPTSAADRPDTITTSQPLVDDGSTLNSSDGIYQMGFFTPGSPNSNNRYLGIWYREIPAFTVVWVANRHKPISTAANSSSGLLQLTDAGILILLDRINGTTIWSSSSSSSSSSSVTNPVAQLLNSGNLVVKPREGEENLDNSIWQSFDYPSDTFLPGMKLGRNLITGLNRQITSWVSPDDPSPGNFTCGMELGGYPELVQRRDSVETFRTGPWNGQSFTGTPHLNPNPVYTYNFVFTEEETYYIFHLRNASVLSRMVSTPSGLIQRYTWQGSKQGWMIYLTAQNDNCDRYALCGAYGSCDIESSPSCGCLQGFVPRDQKEWDMVDWSNGCVRKTELNCSGDGFVKHSGIKMPQTRNSSWFNVSMSLEECKEACIRNCSCTAYANLDIRNGGSGCLIWFTDLLDIRVLYDNRQDLYIRMAASDIDESGLVKNNDGRKSKKKNAVLIILGSGLSAGVVLVALGFIIWYKIKRQQQNAGKDCSCCFSSMHKKSDKDDIELPLFDVASIASATNNFSSANVLGQGGFGRVYKGILKDGQEVAVKRMSKDSNQGAEEFKNEAINIAKLQHRNLVRLLGCCIQRDERMLVYEFMPNRSLDVFIFDRTQSQVLDWPKRYNIIKGIARGIVYLHQDSRLRIVHRDLKASNVLLDYEMNPKISDFGLARTFVGNESQGNTRNVVGTYGYMSPEYVIDGVYSIKSDVFSFGVMVLEVVHGERNRKFHHPDHELNLLGHAWHLHMEGRGSELMDATMGERCNQTEVLRLVHIGLLCVQKRPDDRPSMAEVAVMIDGDGELPEPNQPGFFTERNVTEVSTSSSASSGNRGSCSNSMSVTQLEPR
ncbi:G-type lectin S-receptor-like serine/threonine-protein kinase At4g27290 [Linum perenne]